MDLGERLINVEMDLILEDEVKWCNYMVREGLFTPAAKVLYLSIMFPEVFRLPENWSDFVSDEIDDVDWA